jgi:ribosomal protein L29
MLTLKELKNLSEKELENELIKATKDLFKQRFEVNTGTSKAHHKIRDLRKYRAQILTVKNQTTKQQEKVSEAQKQ